MLTALQILAVTLVAITAVPALAHALELPGKMRLSKEEYLVVQRIYYPGFTIGGTAEPISIALALGFVIAIPAGSVAFWLAVGALGALGAMHSVYWFVTHPVNEFWLKDVELRGVGRGFFSFDPLRRDGTSRRTDWIQLRDRWEYSHVARAGFGMLGLVLMVAAVATD